MKQLKSKLEMVVLNHFSKGSVYGLELEVIQDKKLENVKAVHDIEGEEVLLIYDGTLFGSAKDGMVFTENSVYWREMLGSSQKLDYREIIESTAHINTEKKMIELLDVEGKIKLKEAYYDLICELREELVRSFIVYDTYYKSALKSFEQSLINLAEKEKYNDLIKRVNKYQGLFLRERDKSAGIYEVLFKAYLAEKDFALAKEALDILEDKSPGFYKEAAPLLEHAIKQERYHDLEIERVEAMAGEDYKEAYLILQQQKNLNIIEKEKLAQIELEMKEIHYKSLEVDRLKTMKTEDYDLAFSLLEKQKEINIKSDFEIENIRKNMELTKKQKLRQYHEALKVKVETKDFQSAKELISQIYKIDPLYPLEREELQMMIYKYKLKEVEEVILATLNPILKLELETIFNQHIKLLYEDTRWAARNKDYEYFKAIPNVWYYKDQYSMSPLDYFALEGDLDGVLMALDYVDLTFMEANVFGHNFIDLIGLGGAVGILKTIQPRVDLKQMEDRLGFFQRGQEGVFFSYHMSEEVRLLELNKSLMSPSHFKAVYEGVKNQASNDVDTIIKHIFAQELEDMDTYPVKDEFETSEGYQKRSRAFKQQYLDRADFIEEYKRQNQPMVELIQERLAQGNSCFVPAISAWIDYKDKDMAFLESMEREEGVIKLLDLYFPIKLPTIELGNYNPDLEVFDMLVDQQVKQMKVPLSLAREFKESFNQLDLNYHRVIEDETISTHYVYEFEGQKFVMTLEW